MSVYIAIGLIAYRAPSVVASWNGVSDRLHADDSFRVLQPVSEVPVSALAEGRLKVPKLVARLWPTGPALGWLARGDREIG